MSNGDGAFGIGQVLTTSWSVMLRHFFLFFVLAFVANIPNLVIDLLAPQDPSQWMKGVATDVQAAAPIDPAMREMSPWVVFPLIAAGIVLSFALSAAATYLVVADLRGTPFNLAEALLGGVRALLPLLGVLVLLMLMFIGFAIVIGLVWGILAYGVLNDPQSPFGIVVGLFFIVPVIVVALRLSLTVPVIVVERIGAIDSMKRSAELTRGRIGRLLALFVVVGLIVLSLNLLLFGGAVAILGTETFFSTPGIVARHAILSAEVPFYWALVAVLYYVLRTASERGSAAPV